MSLHPFDFESLTMKTLFSMSAVLGLVFLAASSLTACGGGGGGTPAADKTVAAAPTTAPVAITVAMLVPADAMNWATAVEQPLTILVRHADGSIAAGAAVRVFSLSRTSPQDGTPLEAPVPVSLLDNAVSDSNGRAQLMGRLPAHLTEVLVVATEGAEQGQSAVATNTAGDVTITLAR